MALEAGVPAFATLELGPAKLEEDTVLLKGTSGDSMSGGRDETGGTSCIVSSFARLAAGGRGSESKADHIQPCCFGLNFALIIRVCTLLARLPRQSALPVPLQRTFNARLLKNSLKVRAVVEVPN